MDLPELKARKELIKLALEIIEGDDDVRAEEAVAHYQGQLAEIEKRISELQPPPVVVGLKSATLSAQTKEQ